MTIYELIESKTKLDEIIAMRLRERREMLGISQQALSKATNINIKQIQKYENSSVPIAGSVLYFFAKLLNMPVSYFISDISSERYYGEYLFGNKDECITNMIAEDKSDYIVPIIIDNIPSELNKEVLALVKLFIAIQNPTVRQRIIELTKAISG